MNRDRSERRLTGRVEKGGFSVGHTAYNDSHAAGSAVSIGSGARHFFVPRMWNWYSYIDPSATELAVAVRAINVFFSLSLVLFGLMYFLPMTFGQRANRYSALVVLGATWVLWAVKVVMQLAYPQGSMKRGPAVRHASHVRGGSRRATRLRWCWCCSTKAPSERRSSRRAAHP